MSPARALAAVCLLAAVPAARAQNTTAGPVVGFDLGIGTEEGAKAGKKTLLELEGTLGYEFANRVRPELGLVGGLEPDGHAAVRPGVRLPIPTTPVLLRLALDASNARNESFSWRWLLIGAAGELKITSTFALSLEFDTGVPLRGSAGVPILFRIGAEIRP